MLSGPHHPHHGGGHHHNYQHPFNDWWAPSYYERIIVEPQDYTPPDWVWIAGGALVGAVLALIARD